MSDIAMNDFRAEPAALRAAVLEAAREVFESGWYVLGKQVTAFDATSPVPGGADCVPKVPVGPSFNTIACGNMFEALKWEKRVETAYTHFAAWFLDMRGWGDLPEGTGTHWAPPYQDLQARGRLSTEIYSTGGLTGNSGSAARGTYGW